MSETGVKVLETKLDILIEDFQRFRTGQEKVNHALDVHLTDDSEIQAKLLTTLKWHSVIGTSMASAIGYIFISQLGG